MMQMLNTNGLAVACAGRVLSEAVSLDKMASDLTSLPAASHARHPDASCLEKTP